MTAHRKLPLIEIGFQLYVSDGADPFGAVREVAPGGRPELLVNVEGAGDFTVPLDQVDAVHHQKVVLTYGKLDEKLRHAIDHAHEREDRPGG